MVTLQRGFSVRVAYRHPWNNGFYRRNWCMGPKVRSRGPGVMVAHSYSRNYLLCNSLKYRY